MDQPLNRVKPLIIGLSDITTLANSLKNDLIKNANSGKSNKTTISRLELLENKKEHLIKKLEDTVKMPVMKVEYTYDSFDIEHILTANVQEIRTYLEFLYGNKAHIKKITNLKTNHIEYQNQNPNQNESNTKNKKGRI